MSYTIFKQIKFNDFYVFNTPFNSLVTIHRKHFSSIIRRENYFDVLSKSPMKVLRSMERYNIQQDAS